MSWSFRKTVKRGPVNLNYSKNGIGTSVGFLGFRIGRNAQGRFLLSWTIPGTGFRWIKIFK